MKNKIKLPFWCKDCDFEISLTVEKPAQGSKTVSLMGDLLEQCINCGSNNMDLANSYELQEPPCDKTPTTKKISVGLTQTIKTD